MNTKLLSSLFLISSLAACGSDGDVANDAAPSSDAEPSQFGLAADLVGIYTVTSHLENTESCEPGSNSLLEDFDEYLMAVTGNGNSPGSEEDVFLSLLSCGSPADCRAKLAAREAGEPVSIQYILLSLDDLDQDPLTGFGGVLGSPEQGLCSSRIYESSLSIQTNGFRFEQQLTTGVEYAPDADNSCSEQAARPALDQLPCEVYTVLEATFAEEF